MRYLGLDLGTKTLGVAITDKTRSLVSLLKVIKFPEENYDLAIEELLTILDSYDISKIALGWPKNMNNSLGEASKRSISFKNKLQSMTNIPIYLVDERLTTLEAENILLESDMSRKKRKKIIDGVAAVLILETFLKMEESKNGR